MYAPSELNGVMGMMPAFSTENAADINSVDTIDVGNLKSAVGRIIDDGLDVISTTGSFGECHTLLPEEFKTLAHASVEAVNDRIPLFIGCTSLSSREVVAKMRVVQEAGGQGVLVGVPFYYPSTVDNVVRFYRDIATTFPDLSIMIYHNPLWHRVTIPVAAIDEISSIPNVVAMKDSHREVYEFMLMEERVSHKLSVFVNQNQFYAFAPLGAPGFWSIETWMGPEPTLALRDAIKSNDLPLAKQITLDLASGPKNRDLSWRENSGKISMAFTGYCTPGPLRPPFTEIPDTVTETAKARAAYWQDLRRKYSRK